MAELADAPDLGSGGKPCRFDSCQVHQNENDDHRQRIGVFILVLFTFYYSFFSFLFDGRFRRRENREEIREKVALLRKALAIQMISIDTSLHLFRLYKNSKAANSIALMYAHGLYYIRKNEPAVISDPQVRLYIVLQLTIFQPSSNNRCLFWAGKRTDRVHLYMYIGRRRPRKIL